MKKLNSPEPASGLGRIVGTILSFAVWVVILVVAFTASMIFFAAALGIGLIIAARIWWQTRGLRKQMGEGGPPPPSGSGRVIEGEAVREPE